MIPELRRYFNEVAFTERRYQSFLERVAGHVSTGIATAQAAERERLSELQAADAAARAEIAIDNLRLRHFAQQELRDRTRAERALYASEERYRRQAYDSAQAIWRVEIVRARGAADAPAEARARMWLGLAAWRLGDYAVARIEGEHSLALKRRLGLDAERHMREPSTGIFGIVPHMPGHRRGDQRGQGAFVLAG